jgi:hypothetical protein
MARARRKPSNTQLYGKVVAEAKRRFAVWPSAYASGWVTKTYKARGGRYSGAAQARATGLTKWFGERWVDLARPVRDKRGRVVGYKPCGRSRSERRAYPKCRPVAEAARMTDAQVRDAVSRKRRAERSAPRRRGRAPVRVATYRRNGSFAWLGLLLLALPFIPP